MQSESNKITKAEWRKLFPEKYNKAHRLGLLPEIYKEMGWDSHIGESVQDKITKIINMAKRGEDRPHHKTALGQAWIGYSKTSSGSYRPDLVAKIRELAPGWFVKDIYKNKKDKLIQMAINGEPKPHHTGSLGKLLGRCISPNHRSFDPEFLNEIKKHSPMWIVPQHERLNLIHQEKIKQIINMAKNGEPRPSKRSEDHEIKNIGRYLSGFTNTSSKIYKKDFDHYIRELRPDWFDQVHKTWEDILSFVNKNGRRPSQVAVNKEESFLGKRLSSYLSPANQHRYIDFIKKLPENIDSVSSNCEKIIDFIHKNNRKPSKSSSDPEERRLAVLCTLYHTPKKRDKFQQFIEQVEAISPDKTQVNYRKIYDFVSKYNRIPKTTSPDKDERKMAEKYYHFYSSKYSVHHKVFRLEIDRMLGSKINPKVLSTTNR